MNDRISFPGIITSGKCFVNLPTVQALWIQVVSFFFVFMLLVSVRLICSIHSSILLVALLQGTVAMSISYRRHMAPWWWLIQFIFPCALVLTLSLDIPSGFFLVAFLLLLGFFWSTFRTQVPFYPSNSEVWESIEKILPINKQIRMIDIGSGLGGLILNLAARRPESTFTGIELAPLPWLLSTLRTSFGKSSAHFIRGNYEHLSLADYEVVFAYLSPAAMSALWQKAIREMTPGSLLLSYEFSIPEANPNLIIPSESGGPNLYGWHM